MKRTHRTRGFGIVELLIAAAIVGLVLAIVASFFSQQAHVTRQVQARNELNMKVRSVAEAVVHDLQLAGGRAVIAANGEPQYVSSVESACGADYDKCVLVDTSDGIELTSVYASSLRELGIGESCRKVVYRYDPGTESVHRFDDGCGSSATPTWGFGTEYATGITRFTLEFTCSDGTVELDPTACFQNGLAGIRQGKVEVAGGADNDSSVNEVMELSANMPNTRAAR